MPRFKDVHFLTETSAPPIFKFPKKMPATRRSTAALPPVLSPSAVDAENKTPPSTASPPPKRTRRSLAEESAVVQPAESVDCDQEDKENVATQLKQPTPPSSGWNLKVLEQDDTVRLDLRLENLLQPTRKASTARVDGPLYKVETLASVERVSAAGKTESQTPESSNACRAYASPTCFCLLVGSDVYLMDPLASSHQATISLDCRPEIAAFSRDGKFLVIGDRLGTVHFVHVDSRTVVFSQVLLNKDPLQGNENVTDLPVFQQMLFLSDNNESQEQLFVLMSNSTLLRFTCVDFMMLSEALASGSTQLAMEVKQKIKVENIHLNQVHGESVCAFSALSVKGNTLLVAAGKGEYCMSIWDCTEETFALVDKVGRAAGSQCIKLVQFTSDARRILTLDEDGNVGIWDRKRLLLLKFLPLTGIQDFYLLPNKPSALSIVALRHVKEHSLLQLLHLPSLADQHSVEVARATWLAKSTHFLDATFFLEGRIAEGTAVNTISQLFLRSISETIPIHRFNELLQKKKYSEAELFAKSYQLDQQVVLKARVTELIGNAHCDDKKITAMISDLKAIEDDSFVINFCMEASMPSYASTWTFLSLAYERVCEIAKIRPQNSTASPQLIQKVHQIVKKFGTFQLLNGKRQWDSLRWQLFRGSDLLEEVKTAFATGRIKNGILIWRRHHGDERFLDDLVNILENIPEDTASIQFRSWLETEVLPKLTKVEERSKLGSWFEQRARLVEVRDRKPHNALHLLQLLDIGCRTVDTKGYGTPAQYVEYTIARANTAVFSTFGSNASLSYRIASGLRKQLEDMVYLWDTFDYRISLCDYSRETPGSIALALLDRVSAPEMLPVVVDNTFKPYAARHELDVEELIAEYCVEMMDNYNGNSPDSPYESRVLALLPSLKNVDRQLDIGLEVMRRSPIPWSPEVDQLVQTSLTFKETRRIEELKEQYYLMKLKKMLLGYGVKEFNISDIAMAKGFVEMILANTENTNALDDAKQLAGAYHSMKLRTVYVSWCRNLCKVDRSAEAISALNDLEVGEKLSSAKEILLWLESTMENACESLSNFGESVKDQEHQRFRWASVASVDFAQTLVDMNALHSYHITELTGIRNLISEFCVLVTRKQFESMEERKQIMERFAAAQLQQKGMNVDSLNPNDIRLIRLAEILDLQKASLMSILAKTAAASGHCLKALTLCNEIMEADAPEIAAATSAEVVERLVAYMKKNLHQFEGMQAEENIRSIPSRVLALASRSVLSSQGEAISANLDLFKSSEIMNVIFRQCQSGEYETLIKQRDVMVSTNFSQVCQDVTDDYGASLFETDFSDNGLVFHTETAMSLAADFVAQCRPHSRVTHNVSSGKSKKADTTVHFTGEELLGFLKMNRSYLVALNVYQRVQEHQIRNERNDLNRNWSDEIGFYQGVLETLIGKTIAHRHIDSRLAFGCMMALPQKMAFDGLRGGFSTVNNEFYRLSQIAEIGLGAASVWQQHAFTAQLESLAKNAKWWEQLRLLDIPFQEDTFRTNADYRKNLVPLLLKKTCYDIVTVLDFGHDYNIEDDFVILEYIDLHLRSPEAVGDYQPMILGVLEDIVNRGKLLDVLKISISSISPYDYERIRFVFSVIVQLEPNDPIAKKAGLILDILDLYTRVNLPTMEEFMEIQQGSLAATTQRTLEEYKKMFKGCEQRLPYKNLVVKSWQVLDSELSETTLGRLLPLVVPLNLNADDFYLKVMRQMLEKMKSNVGTRLKFADFKQYIAKVTDYAAALDILQQIASTFPCGPERIHAQRVAVNVADKWFKTAGNNSEIAQQIRETLIDARVALGTSELEHLLATARLSEYFGMVNNGNELIMTLYRDLSEPVLLAEEPYVSLDLHQLCEDIALKYEDVNIDKLRDDIFQDLIRSKLPDMNPDLLPSVRFNINEKALGKSERNLQYRLVYLTRSLPLEKSINTLLRFAYDPSQKITTASRIRALCVLLQVAGPVDIGKVHSFEEVREYLQVLFYLIDCEELRISVRTRELYKLEKDALARSLWLNRSGEPRVIEFICNLLLDFNVYSDLPLWVNVLEKLLAMKKYRLLFTVFERANAVYELFSMEALPRILNETVSGTLRMLALDLGKQFRGSDVTDRFGIDMDLAERMLQLYHQCPILSVLDVLPPLHFFEQLMFTAESVDIGTLGFKGTSALLYLLENNQEFLEKFQRKLSAQGKQKCTELVKVLEIGYGSFGLFQPGFEVISSAIFDVINDKRWYDLLLTSPKSTAAFADNLIATDNLWTLVKVLVERQQTLRALELVQKYFAHWPERALDVTGSQDLLDAFLEMETV